MSAATRSAARGSELRLAPIEGLRGIAMILVLVSHLWVLAPTADALASPLGGLFRSGNFGVSIFLVLGGFFLVHSLQGEIERTHRVDVKEALLRRLVRISAPVYALVLASLVATALLPASTYAPADTPQSVLRIVTYTWNWFAMESPLLSRPDAGHLWFTSVYVQVTVALILLTAALARRRVLLMIVLVALVVGVTVWRYQSYATEGAWVAFLRTTTRMDGLLWGAVLATALPWLPRLSRPAATSILSISAAGLVILGLTANDSTYFGVAGVLMCLLTAAFVYAVLNGGAGPVAWALSRSPLVALGTWSLALYIWHYPVYWAVSKQTPTWDWVPKTIVAFAIIAALVWAARRFVEEPVRKWLERRRAERPERVWTGEESTPSLRER